MTRYRDDLRQVSTYLDLSDDEQADLLDWLSTHEEPRAAIIRGILLAAYREAIGAGLTSKNTGRKKST